MDPRQVLLDQRARLERKFKEERIMERDVPDLRKYLARPNVLAILGVRRSGKSTLAEFLLRDENFGYVNFDDERLAYLRAEDLSGIEKAVYELFGEVEYFLLDEVQNVEGWELFVNRLREDGKGIIVTGSNSKLLSGELATRLTGRHVDHVLYPFSFPEFLRFRGIDVERAGDVFTSSSESVLKRELGEHMRLGGFPEVLRISDDYAFFIFSDILFKDVVQRLRVKRMELFKAFAVNLLRYFSSEVSLSRLSRTMNLSINTVEEWFDGLRSAYLLLVSERFTERPREAMVSPRKVYAVDPAFISTIALGGEAKGRAMENVVAIHLARRYGRLFYYRGRHEVDFMVGDRAIQVTYASGRDEVDRREVEALDEVRAKEKLVVTWDYEDRQGEVRFVPLWKFLLAG
ncbi:MAG: ATP-binding protein [Conexivisphaera sp.]